MRRRIILVGATGSIGRQCLEVVERHRDRLEIVALAAGSDEDGLRKAAKAWPAAALALAAEGRSSGGMAIRRGQEALLDLIRETEAEIVLNAAAGAAGLRPSLAALDSGKDLALANKESVVMAHPLLRRAAERSGKAVLPVDSEHASLFQLVRRVGREEIDELIITASGGAFRDRPLADLARVGPDEAATHPNWSMGRKITIDSATMANKGLELIEAARLFGFAPASIKVLVHPQSLVHALVRTRDGSLYANLSEPDMRLPIENALLFPEPGKAGFGRLDLAGRSLEFREPEAARYPLLGLAYEALASGEGACVAYNAADEVAVAAFERGSIGFLDIAWVVERCLAAGWPALVGDLDHILDIDREARRAADLAAKDLRR